MASARASRMHGQAVAVAGVCLPSLSLPAPHPPVTRRPAWCSSSRSTYVTPRGVRIWSVMFFMKPASSSVTADSTLILDVMKKAERGRPLAVMAALIVGWLPATREGRGGCAVGGD